jgi:AraC family transcriptional regulator
MYPVEIRQEAPRRVVGIGHEGAYNQIGGAFARLSALVTARDLWPEVREYLGVYLDDPYEEPEADLRSMAAIAVDEALPLPEGMQQMHLAGGRHAVLRLVGPYTELPAAYEWFFRRWLPDSGETARDAPSLEIYRNDPDRVAAADLVTEIYMPIV